MNVADASAVGAAMLGINALGIINNLQEIKKMIHIQHTYSRIKESFDLHEKFFRV